MSVIELVDRPQPEPRPEQDTTPAADAAAG
jgi:hypothetical protein